jgi:hypothetical protein
MALKVTSLPYTANPVEGNRILLHLLSPTPWQATGTYLFTKFHSEMEPKIVTSSTAIQVFRKDMT